MSALGGEPSSLARAAGRAMDARSRLRQPERSRRLRTWLNFVVFKLGWIVCVLGAARGQTAPALAWAGLAYGLAVFMARRPAGVALMVPACALLGLAADSLLVARGAIAFPLDPPAVLGMPLWIGAIWIVFATTFGGCLAWLAGRPWIAFLAGAVGSPLSFRAAASLGALEVAPGGVQLATVSVVWGLLLPLEFALARRLMGAPAD